MKNSISNSTGREKILLVLLPYWTSLIPPLGISCLKSFLQSHGYRVKTVDANIEKQFQDIYYRYFDTLKQVVPAHKRGNFFNTGNDVLRNHMMAYFHRTVGDERKDDREYTALVKSLVNRTYFCPVDRSIVLQLDKIMHECFRALKRYFIRLLEKEKPGILGISVYNGTLPASMFAFKLAKEKYPHIKTVMGGGVFADQLEINSPGFKIFLEKTPYIDHIIVGEGETLFLKLLRCELPRSRRVYTLKDIGGKTLDLASAHIPDFSDFNPEQYPAMASYVSRSCPFQCSFCSETLQWGKYRKKQGEQIAAELLELYRKYNYQLFLLGDSLLNPVIHQMAESLIGEDKAVYWDGYLRADALAGEPGNTLLWRRAGFYRARLGLESGSRHVLELMGKRLNPGQIKAAVSSLASAGIKTTTYWVIGHPGETEEDFRQTLDLVEELKDDIYEADCNPFNFYFTGQVSSKKWKQASRLLYPGAEELLVVPAYTLDIEPQREEIYARLCRFTDHCRHLGIPNPYSLNDIYQADERWQKLKKNAVPPLADFKMKGSYIDECKLVKSIISAPATMQHDDDWGF